LRISRQSKGKGCESPKALSSVTMAGEIAAVKVIKQKFSPHQEENRKAMNANKIKSRSPIEADLNERRS